MNLAKIALLIGVLYCIPTQASESIIAHDQDITDIQALTKSIYQQATDPDSLPKNYILGFILPTDLKKYHCVTGTNGKRGKLIDLEESFSPGSNKFNKFVALMENSSSHPIKFSADRTYAVIQKPGSSLKAKFQKHKGKWYVSY